jgi:hypothetical protein
VVDKSSELESTVEALLTALAIQAGESGNVHFVRGALEELTGLSREAIRRVLGSIGHLVHYGSGSDVEQAEQWLEQLFEELIATLRRASDDSPGKLRPGDLVELTVDRVNDRLRAGTAMRVYFVGDDGTADVGFESLWDEYLVYSVELEQLRPRVN